MGADDVERVEGPCEPFESWPAGRVFGAGEAVAARCGACRTNWGVPRDLAGYRFRCAHCDAWVSVAAAESVGLLARSDPAPQALPAELTRAEGGLARLDLAPGRAYDGEVPTSLAVAPGTLMHARVRVQQRWSNRAVLELTAVALALLAPFSIAMFALPERQAALVLPLASVVSGLLIVLIGFGAPRYTFGGLRPAPARAFGEACVAAGAFVAVALGWIRLVTWLMPEVEGWVEPFNELREVLGIEALLGVVAVAPAVLEELAFRGLLQGRLTAILGRRVGILVVACVFALAHGVSIGSPMHIALGVYLGFLRDRTGSLLPGMLVHFLYNAAVVLLFTH